MTRNQMLPPMGRDCLITPEHGASFIVGKGAEWCPHSAHLLGDPKAITPQLLSKQEAWLDERAKTAPTEAAAS
jgi:hypothetical protein